MRFGFLISPAINVTPFQASLENKDPTIAAEIPVNKAVPPIGNHEPVSELNERVFQASDQFAFQTSAFAANNNPKIIKPNKDRILITVKIVCNVLLFLTPLLLT